MQTLIQEVWYGLEICVSKELSGDANASDSKYLDPPNLNVVLRPAMSASPGSFEKCWISGSTSDL